MVKLSASFLSCYRLPGSFCGNVRENVVAEETEENPPSALIMLPSQFSADEPRGNAADATDEKIREDKPVLLVEDLLVNRAYPVV